MRHEIKRQSENLLHSARLYRTNPRVAILALLMQARKPQTADEIAVSLASAGPNKVTIYRTLETLVNAGLVHKVFLQERCRHFELSGNCSRSQYHPHFTCTNCGDTHCLTEMSPPMAKSPHKGFLIRRQRIQLEGLCPKCNT